ncbi:alpha/beta hydrolase [Alteribacillus sp. HJP-4]|uniref:alpha/beta hydrolase n=1 Tax=Alteribacillus sp. HJP-4 TaxID=2775394 RepID=UPI0035CCD9F0
MWRKGIKIFLLSLTAIGLFIAWSIEDWSQTAQGELPSKTAVILHAVNNNLVPMDIDIEAPNFLSSAPVSNSDAKMLRDDLSIPVTGEESIPVRVYRYSDAEDAPVLIYYHGGAFLDNYGNLDTHDNIMRSLASRTGAVVISPGYRTAPEHVFPTAVNDSYDALLWAEENAERFGGSPDKIAVAGDSAGGNLAAVTAMKARDENGPDLFAQLLYYPLTTFQDKNLDSRTTYDSGEFLLSRQVMMQARDAYTPDASMWSNPYSSPLGVADLEGLPPAYIVTAEFDPLRDEGELYGKYLHEHGVPVKTVRYEGVMHGFVSFYEIMKSGDRALTESARFLQTASQGETTTDEKYAVKNQHGPGGFVRMREEAEAFAIGAFLVGKSTMEWLD